MRRSASKDLLFVTRDRCQIKRSLPRETDLSVSPDFSLHLPLSSHFRKEFELEFVAVLGDVYSLGTNGSACQVRPERAAGNFLRPRRERLCPVHHQIMAGTDLLPAASEAWNGMRHLPRSGTAEILTQCSRCPHTALLLVI